MSNLKISKLILSFLCMTAMTVPQGAFADDFKEVAQPDPATKVTVVDSAKTLDAATAAVPTPASPSVDPASTATVDLTKIMTETTTTPAPKTTKLFREEIRQFASPALDEQIDKLVEDAVVEAGNKKLLEEKEHHYNKFVQVAVASSKDIAELATSYKGFEQSSEAADVVLEEKIKLKSRASVAYAKQHQRDLLHAKVVASMMQIALARGLKDQSEGKAAEAEAVTQLTGLVGADKTAKTVALVNEWCEHCQDNLAPDSQPIVGPIKMKSESDKIMKTAMASDEIVGEIKGKLHKYNGRSNLARATAKVVNTTLSLAAFTPTFISPAAQVAWCAYIVTQGGPEESKLLKEVYLAKRFESRWQMLNEEANLALNSYNTGIYTHNPTLLAFSQFLISRMGEPVPADAAAEAPATKASATTTASPGATAVDLAKSGNDSSSN
jgi:hypothetical protein